MKPCDVFAEYTKPNIAKANILTALKYGAHVVVGTSGLNEEDFAEIDRIAREQNRGVLACGNFALTVVLLQKFAEAAAKLIPQWEIFDYAHDGTGRWMPRVALFANLPQGLRRCGRRK